MALIDEFIRKNKILYGLGALLMVGCADAAQIDNPSSTSPAGDVQPPPPRVPESATKASQRQGLQTPPAISSPHDTLKHGSAGDPRTRPEQAKIPQRAGDPDAGIDDVTP